MLDNSLQFTGLERPEKLSLVYPTALVGRLAFGAQKESVTSIQTFEPKAGLVNAEEVRLLASICVRLEAISSSRRSPFDPSASTNAVRRGETDNRASRYIPRNPDLLLPHITIEMTDEDLLAILDSRKSCLFFSSFFYICIYAFALSFGGNF